MLLLGGFAIAAALSKHALAKRGATWILARVGGRPSVVLLTNMLARACPPPPSPPYTGYLPALARLAWRPAAPPAGGGTALPRSSQQCCQQCSRVPPSLRACWAPAAPARAGANTTQGACMAALLNLATESSLAARARRCNFGLTAMSGLAQCVKWPLSSGL